ncbi:MAG: decaprenyl-phosphate phosphoribosyltransferase [Candidatus Woesearchaeota archaeon]
MRDAEATVPRLPPRQTAAHARQPAAGAPSAEASVRGGWQAALVTMRPRQWIKNLLVIAAAGAAGALGHDDVPVRVGLAFVAFCMLASGIYAINDVRDADEDRRHPRKRFRPVAAGELAPRAAVLLGLALMVTGLVICALIVPLLAVVAAGYLALSLSYTMVWRHLLLLDIIAIGGGFLLRAVAGGVASPVTLSRWFLLVVSAASVFVAAGKRNAELRRTTLTAVTAGRRRVLEGYTEARLRLILIASAALAIFAYAVWAFQLPAVAGVPWRPLTLIPFAAGIVRYGVLVRAGRGESPEELLLGDRLLQAAGALWLVLFALGVHAAG